MIIVMKPRATEKSIERVVKKIEKAGMRVHVSKGTERTIIGAIGDERVLQQQQLKSTEGVEKVMSVLKPYRLASREFHPENTIIDADGVKIGGKKIVLMAGPCAVENRKQIITTAKIVKKTGAEILRGGAFKPRTSPYDFQGLGEEGLKLLAEARKLTGLKIVTEVMETEEVALVAQYADILQIGARNMQNFNLLKAVGKIDKPILLKRGMSATLKEFLMSAEYIMSEGNHKVILCERGIRTFVEYTRNTLDLTIVPAIKKLSHLPIIVDPSHGTGEYDFVIPMSKAAIACGADGLMIEVHPNPEEAASDGDQSLTPKRFENLMREIKPIVKAVKRDM
ncbi:MAG: 3-deoxy-7-phosphoheptulonate synthase [Proteobacteria bacterium]|nr:3-deoxy-7-phosphoheptulonate synthase [Pseudomonadota bacterium]MBU4504148.1 3-deoxy-7-phosphoheptulonate synthase [Pseudomonadota bacterium]